MISNELMQDPTHNDLEGFSAKQATIWTALPGIINSVDLVAMTCTVMPAIQGINYKPNKDALLYASNVNMPLLLDCPLVFQSAGGCTITLPVQRGDECTVIFYSRCMDGWYELGAFEDNTIVPRPQLEIRMHDLSDGCVIVGQKSKKTVIPNVSTTELQVRSNDGKSIISIHPTTHVITITSDSSLDIVVPETNITGNVNISGTLHTTKNISSDTDVIANSISLHNHTHSDPQGGSVGAPQ